MGKYNFKISFAENEAFRGYEESIGKDESDFQHVKAVVNRWASNGEFTLVGQGKQTNSKCGTFAGFKGCIRTELHHNTLAGNFEGLVYAHPVFHSCDRPSCPLCFKRGWAVRQAGHVKQRLDKACKQHGFVEHIIAAVSPSDYKLSYEALRRKVVKALTVRGITGGCLIFMALDMLILLSQKSLMFRLGGTGLRTFIV